jgi:hypothetical protein
MLKRLHFVRLSVLLTIAMLRAGLYSGGTVRAQSPVGTVSNIPLPDFNAYQTSLRYDSSGNLYAWDGLNVWKQSAGASVFNNIGSVAAGNSADAGPIGLSQDATTLLLSNGAGGYAFDGNGYMWTMPAAGAAATRVAGGGVPYAGDALALPTASTISEASTKYIVYEGNSSWSGSSLSIFDAATGTNKVVIGNGPGATASIAIDPKTDSVYVGVGSGSYAGNIYSFGLSQIDAAYEGTQIDFLTAGTLFNSKATGFQSGAGMFFDDNGYLFSGGLGITVFRPDGTICYDHLSGGKYGYTTLAFDPLNNEVLNVPYGSSTGLLYRAADFETIPEPSTLILLCMAGIVGAAWLHWRRCCRHRKLSV